VQLGESVEKEYHARRMTVRNGVKNGDNRSLFVSEYLRGNEILDETDLMKEFVVTIFSNDVVWFFCART
jgi:hypothetical protein